jgi:hypothetical protein
LPPEDLSLDAYIHIGDVLATVERARPWWWGDFILYGDAKFGERYAQAMDMSGLAYTTLAHYASVCRQIQICRRRQNLYFSHHAAVARLYLTPAQQDQLLLDAERYVWTVERLEEERDKVRDVFETVDRYGIPGADAVMNVMPGDNGPTPSEVSLVWIESDESADDDYQADGGRFIWCPHCGARVDF